MKDLSIMVYELIKPYFKMVNEGKEIVRNHHVLINNQNDSNSIYLLGYFNYRGIGICTNINTQKAFELYQTAAELEIL